MTRDRGHGSPYDRGWHDSYYGRQPRPHKWIDGIGAQRVDDLTPDGDHQMTPQEMFDKAYLGVIQQGKKSAKPSRTCAYRGVGGTKCGIGYLIPDKLAHAWDRRINSSISRIKPTKHHPIPQFIQDNLELASAIQSAHDFPGASEGFIEHFKELMESVAKRFNLTIPQLEQHQ